MRVEFSEPLPFKVDIEYEFFSSTEGSVPFLNLSNKSSISAKKDDTKVDFEFFIPSSSGFTGASYYGLTLKNFQSSDNNNYLDVRATGTAPKSYEMVSAGSNHTCGIDNGKLYCWGRDHRWQIGNGIGGDEDTPVQIVGSKTWSMVSSGGEHTCALTNNGMLYGFGSNSFGQVKYKAKSIIPTVVIE